MKPIMNRSGFTLIEILIVVVILAVLAAIVIPRFLPQHEKAIMAEANQMLGTMVRAQTQYMNINGATNFLSLNSTDLTNWTRLGLQYPNASNFLFSCDPVSNSCTATRSNPSSEYNGSTIRLLFNNTFNCTGNYTAFQPDANGNSKRGCTT